jgi:hypothetical protein
VDYYYPLTECYFTRSAGEQDSVAKQFHTHIPGASTDPAVILSNKTTVVLVDQSKPAVIEISLIEQSQPIFDPRSCRKLSAVVRFRV